MAQDQETDLSKGTLSKADRDRWLKAYQQPDTTTDQEILEAMGAGLA